MRYAKKTPSKEGKRSNQKEDHHIQNLVSLRVSDQEKKLLEKLAKSTSMTVSQIMREAMELWLSRRRRLSLDS